MCKKYVKIIIKLLFAFLLTICSTSQLCYAEVRNTALESVLNQISVQQANQTNQPQFADRTNTNEIVDPITGSLTLKQTDITLPGKDGLNLSIGRVYNSAQAEYWKKRVKVEVSATGSVTTSPLGYYFYLAIYNKNTNQWTSEYIGPSVSFTASLNNYYFYKNLKSDTYTYIPSDPFYGRVITTTTTTTTTTISDTEKYNYLRTRYDLGAGWAFSFPSLQIETDGDNNQVVYLHDGGGAVYHVQFSNDGIGELENYQGKDIQLLRDNSLYTNEDNVASAFKLIGSDKRETYFASDGRLLGIRDRFGNQLKFKHVMRPMYGKNYPFISRITDSVGRYADFVYDSSDGNNSANENITINISYGNDCLSLTYNKYKQRINDFSGAAYYEPCLARVTNPEGKSIYYTDYYWYNNETYPKVNFNFGRKDIVSNYTNSCIYLLGRVNYPNTLSYYQYESTTRNLGPQGATNAFRIKTRYDKQWHYDGNEWHDKGDLYHTEYTYSGDCTGYPTYASEEAMPEGYQFSSSSMVNGITAKTTINGKKQPIEVETVASNGEKKTVKNLEFNTTFIFKPTKTEISEYASDGSLASQLYIGQTFKDWGGLESVTKPLTSAQFNDLNTRAKYTTTYFYDDPNYMYISTGKQWYQNETLPILSESKTLTPDGFGRMSTETNPKGETTTYNYGTIDNGKTVNSVEIAIPIENGKTSKTKITYDSTTNYAFPTITENFRTNEQGQYVPIKTTRTYRMLLGLVETEKDNNNRITTYNYDRLGRVTYVRKPDFSNTYGFTFKEEQEFKYYDGCEFTGYVDDENKGFASSCVFTEKKFTDANDPNSYFYYNASEIAYDGYGNLRQSWYFDYDTQKWTVKTRCTYDSRGYLYKTIDALGNADAYGYDAWNRVSKRTDALNNIYRSDYDVKTRKTTSYFVAAANASLQEDNNYKEHVVETYADEWGRVITKKAYKNWPDISTGAISENYTYDISGNLITYTDPKRNLNSDGFTKKYEYDLLGRVVKVTDAMDQQTDINYTVLGDIQSVTMKKDKNSTQSMPLYTKSYDEIGNQKSKVDPSQKSINQIYNELGLNSQTIDRNGNTFAYQYDEQNRMKFYKGTLPSGSGSIEYRTNYSEPYGPSDVRDFRNNSYAGQTMYDYFSNGQVKDKNIVYGGDTYYSYLNNTYDTAERLKSVGIGKDGSNYFYTNYHYDRMQLDRVQTDGSKAENASEDVNAKYTYYPDELLKTVTYPKLNTGAYLATNYTYNKIGKLESIRNTNGNSTLSYFTYTYDDNGNIASVKDEVKNITATYVYDKLNRLQDIYKNGAIETSYAYDLRGNRQTSIGNEPIIGYNDVSYSYDVIGRLQTVSADGVSTSFKYNTDGLRYKKDSAGTVVKYHYNSQGQVIAEADATGKITSNYVWGPDKLLAKKKSTGEQYYYLYNGHGDVIQIVDSNGNVVNNYEYDEWGNITSQTETIDNPFKYAGECFDKETGLYYLRARYYDPTIGRFITEDSYEGQVTNPLSLNIYTYCNNDPVNFIDASGHMPVETLRWLSWTFNRGMVTGKSLSISTFINNGKGVWTAFHEIAQLNIAKKLYEMNYSPVLEYRIKSTSDKYLGIIAKSYEADIVANDTYVWEVKPIAGKDPKHQKELYKQEGNMELGFKLDPIDDIPIINNIKMEITFPAEGEALYAFYRLNDQSNKDYVTSSEVRKEYLNIFYYFESWLEDAFDIPVEGFDIPLLPELPGGISVPGGAGVPALVP